MKKVKSLQFVILLIISGLIGYYFGINKVEISWNNYEPSVAVVNKEAPVSLENVDFSVFWNIWKKLEANYYNKTKLDPQKMVNGAIEGMISSLGDPYTVYLPPTQNADFKNGLAGQFSGIGAELGTKDNQIIVIAPLEGSPAEKAGIRAADVILKVDSESTADLSLIATVEKIRGPRGTSVVLTVLHKDSNKEVDIKIVRDTITVKSVAGWVKDIHKIDGIKISADLTGKVSYVRLSQFGDSTNKDWVSIINEIYLKIQEDKLVKGIILDLRNNPGGYITDAQFIASEFLPKGDVIVYQEADSNKIPLKVERQGLFVNNDIKIRVLLNRGSASASEIVAGALRDYDRAVLVGETSFGKGTIQQAEDIGNGAGLHITVAKWLTPNEIWVHGKGLKPDIEVKIDDKDPSHDAQLEKAVLDLLK